MYWALNASFIAVNLFVAGPLDGTEVLVDTVSDELAV